MIVYVETAKKAYVTEIPDDGQDLSFSLAKSIALDPRKTCEVIQMINRGKDGLEVSNNLVALENPRTDDLSRLSFMGQMWVKPVSMVEVNPRGPFAKSYRVQMGRSIIEAVDIRDDGRGRLRVTQ